VKVAVTHPYSWPEVMRGGERILVETARALASRGHSVTILTSGRQPGRRQEDNVSIVTYRRLWKNPARHEAWFAWRIAPELARRRYDVVHSLMPRDALVAIRLARWGGHRTVFQDLGIPVKDWWWDKPDRRARIDVVRRVDVYGCMSKYVLGVLERDHGRRGALIPGGVRLDEFQPAPQRTPRPTVLYSGTLAEPRKGIGTLLSAVAIVSKTQPDIQLWLSGPGDPGPLLAAAPVEATKRTEVLELRHPNRQAERYGRAWVTALPSTNEAFGLVLVESLACGTPIVVADDSAPPEMVRPGTGAISRPGDPESLAEALLRGLELAQQPTTAGRCRAVAEGYDWDTALAPALELLYRGDAASGQP
jgi:phosphatidylinositol alpha-mannosyltransferase